VRAPIQRSFALEENLADIGARTSAQQVLADSLGLVTAVALSAAARRIAPNAHPGALPLAMFAPLACADLCSVHAELKAVALRTLNKERAEICAAHFLAHGDAPSPTAVAARERLLLPAALDASPLPLRIGSLSDAARDAAALAELLQSPAAARDRYALAYVPCTRARRAWRMPWAQAPAARPARGSAALALQDGVDTPEVLQALLQVAHLRRLPCRHDLTPDAARAWALRESYARARRDRRAFVAALRAARWQTEHVLLSSAERAPYTL
jgi:glutamate N-acetyltransferase/amino-acid N-acetyltransferase